jgi:glycosyltransferase involved in cell wall biosynthesis
MERTAEALERMGVDVAVGSCEEAREAPFDVVHLMMGLQMPGEFANCVQTIATLPYRPLIAASTIWAPHALHQWFHYAKDYMFAKAGDLQSVSLESLEPVIRAFRERAAIRMGEAVVSPFGPDPATAELRPLLSSVDVLLPNSWMEFSALCRYIGTSSSAVHVVPNAVQADLFGTADCAQLPEELRRGPYVLMSARFDSRKQQDYVALALKSSDLPLVFVGGVSESAVFERFRAICSNRKAAVHYFDHVSQDALAQLYAGARVHMLPSTFESPGLSSLEAAIAGCSVVVGNQSFEFEYFQGEAYYCDPCDARSIRDTVERAFAEHHSRAQAREQLRERIMTRYTWDIAARETLAAYEEGLARR